MRVPRQLRPSRHFGPPFTRGVAWSLAMGSMSGARGPRGSSQSTSAYERVRPSRLVASGKRGAMGSGWRKALEAERLVESFCIVTVEPNELCRTVHDRMPLILSEQDYATWLDPETSQRAVEALMRPYAAREMECYPVSTAVNSVRNETVTCVERVE